MRTKNVGYAIFLGIVLLICVLPSASMLWRAEETAVGNERLAASPSLLAEDGTLNPEILEEFSDYFADHFGYRHTMITLNNELSATVFGTLDSESVLLGSDGWLFYRKTEADYTGTNLFSARQSYAAARTLALMQEFCERNGIAFYFTIAPNKNSLYGEKMPASYPAATVRNANLLTQQLEAQGVHYLDLYAVLAGQEGLYYKYDSHWNGAGAQRAAEALLDAMGTPTDFDALKTGETQAHTGDLYEMVYPSGTETEADDAYAFHYEYLGNFRNAEDITIRTANASAQGSIFVYRDSFGNNLHTFLAEAYGNACFSRSMPYKLNSVLQEDPDVLLVEIVERNLDWLLERAPEVASPVRRLRRKVSASEQTVSMAYRESNLDGYLCITGDLKGVALDEDSPIYLLAGDTVYEAFPCGTGEVPFTAYLPADTKGQTLQVVVKANGVLTACAPTTLAG